jgi:hypothetical protein
MATYAVVTGRLVCTGLDITTAGIVAAVNANSGSLSLVNGQAATASSFVTPSGYRTTYISAEIVIGDNSTPSLWAMEREAVNIFAEFFRQEMGDIRLGRKNANGTIGFGSLFGFDSVAAANNTLGWERWFLSNGSHLFSYASTIYCDRVITLPLDFGGVDMEGCYVASLFGIGDGGSFVSGTYQNQTLRYKNCIFGDSPAGVGLKLYMGAGNTVNYILEGNKVVNNLFAIQPGPQKLVLVDFEVDSNTFHSVPNVGNCLVYWINPDFLTLRVTGNNNFDVNHICFRYDINILDANQSPVSGAKVRLIDGSNVTIVNDALSVDGEVTLPSENGVNYLFYRTYNGASAVQRWNHFLTIVKYGFTGVFSNFVHQADRTDTVLLLADDAITELDKLVVDAYTTLETPEKLYDRAASYQYDQTSAVKLLTRSGSLIDAGSYSVVIDATAASAFAFDGSTITIKASTFTGDMTTTGVITLANGATFIGTRTDANGTVAPPKTVSITGITEGSRLQIYNVTTASEIVNTVVAGTSYTATYEEGTGYSEGDVVRVRLTYQSGTTAKLPYSAQAVVGASGWSILAAQADDTVYASLGIDGEAVTEFVADFPNVQVDISDPDGSTRVDRLYAWFVHTQAGDADGIRLWFGGILPEDEANFRIITSILNLKIDNIAATGVTFTDGRRLYRDDNASPLVSSTTGGGSITFFSGKVYTSVVNTASAPVITGDISQVPAAVQSGLSAQGYTTARAAKIDSIATAAEVVTAIDAAAPSVNLAKVNDLTIIGSGNAVDPFRPET